MWGDRHHLARSAGNTAHDSLASATNFLLSIDEEELTLQQTEEFRRFLTSVEQLKRAHERINIVRKSPPASSHSSLEERDIPQCEQNDSSPAVDTVHPLIEEGASEDHQLSFFQQTTASPELTVNILDFLASGDLARLGSACSQMYALCRSHAGRRCPWNIQRRQLSTIFQLLRCAEQMNEGSIPDGAPHVPFPLLLPKRRILVSNCGDSDYNGVYYCTDCNCNGFVFSKLLSPRQRFPEGLLIDDNGEATSPPGHQLRCMISKQFSEMVRVDVCLLKKLYVTGLFFSSFVSSLVGYFLVYEQRSDYFEWRHPQFALGGACIFVLGQSNDNTRYRCLGIS